MACRGACCCSSAGRLNADNARFLLLAVLIVLYMLCGAAVFSAIELPTEREAKERWEERLENFTRRHNLSRAELRHFLREYEEASVAGIRVDDIRPRWDFTGAFYFVGTVVSTIGERRDGRALGRRRGQGWGPGDALLLSSSPARGLTAGSCRCPGMVRRLRCSFFCLLPVEEPLPRARLSREALSCGSAPEAPGSAAGAGAELRAARAARTGMLFAVSCVCADQLVLGIRS